jgi:hypothetical protein
VREEGEGRGVEGSTLGVGVGGQDEKNKQNLNCKIYSTNFRIA